MFKLIDGDFPQGTALGNTFNNSFLVVVKFLHVEKTALKNNVKEVRRLSQEELESYIFNYKFAFYSKDLKKSLDINSNIVTFECILQDGRKFIAIDDISTFYIFQKFAGEFDSTKVESSVKEQKKEPRKNFSNIGVLLNNIVRNIFGYFFLLVALVAIFSKESSFGIAIVMLIFAIITIPKSVLYIEETTKKKFPNWLNMIPIVLTLLFFLMLEIITNSYSPKLSENLNEKNISKTNQNNSIAISKPNTSFKLNNSSEVKRRDSKFEAINLTLAQEKSIREALSKCGITQIESIKRMEYSQIGFDIKAKNVAEPIFLYLKENNKNVVEQICFSAEDLYLNGKVLRKFSNYIMSNEERMKIQISSEDYVRNSLKSPSSAKFPNYDEWNIYKKNGTIFAESYVDAQNGLGAMIRNYFKLKIVNNNVIEYTMDGKNMF